MYDTCKSSGRNYTFFSLFTYCRLKSLSFECTRSSISENVHSKKSPRDVSLCRTLLYY